MSSCPWLTRLKCSLESWLVPYYFRSWTRWFVVMLPICLQILLPFREQYRGALWWMRVGRKTWFPLVSKSKLREVHCPVVPGVDLPGLHICSLSNALFGLWICVSRTVNMVLFPSTKFLLKFIFQNIIFNVKQPQNAFFMFIASA